MPAHIRTVNGTRLSIDANSAGNAASSTNNVFGSNDNVAVFSETPVNNEFMNGASAQISGTT
jgi:hypothetical protein